MWVNLTKWTKNVCKLVSNVNAHKRARGIFIIKLVRWLILWTSVGLFAWLPHFPHQFSCSVASDSLRLHGLQHARLSCPSPSPRACSDSCPSSQWCHPTTSFFLPMKIHLVSSSHLNHFTSFFHRRMKKSGCGSRDGHALDSKMSFPLTKVRGWIHR